MIKSEDQVKIKIKIIPKFPWIFHLLEAIFKWFDLDPTVYEFMKFHELSLTKELLNQHGSYLENTYIYLSSIHDFIENRNWGESPHPNVLYKP